MPPSYKGEIQLILGPMFAGKSTELLRRMRRFQIAKKRCLYIKFLHDTRYSKDCIATHDRQTIKACPSDRLAPFYDVVDNYDCIGIDEGQFFPDLVQFCEDVANKGKIVIVAALDGTFQRKPFGDVLQLVPMAEKVTKLNAVCMICCDDAAFTTKIVPSTNTVEIGGSDKYLAVCRSCYMTTPDSPHSPAKAHIQNCVSPIKEQVKKLILSPQKVDINLVNQKS